MWIVELEHIISRWLKERTREQRKSIFKTLALLKELGDELGLPNVRNLNIVFLVAGDKDTQSKDIGKAKQLLKRIQGGRQ